MLEVVLKPIRQRTWREGGKMSMVALRFVILMDTVQGLQILLMSEVTLTSASQILESFWSQVS